MTTFLIQKLYISLMKLGLTPVVVTALTAARTLLIQDSFEVPLYDQKIGVVALLLRE
jgi:hypothetical protein